MDEQLKEMLHLFKNGLVYTRYGLSQYFGVSDRIIRKMIEELRNNNYPIVSTSKSGGYYLWREGMSKTDLEIMYREIYSRIKKLRKMIKPIDKILHGEDQQMVMF